MVTRAEVIALCLRLPDSYEDYPFDDPNWTVMRHKTCLLYTSPSPRDRG